MKGWIRVVLKLPHHIDKQPHILFRRYSARIQKQPSIARQPKARGDSRSSTQILVFRRKSKIIDTALIYKYAILERDFWCPQITPTKIHKSFRPSWTFLEG